MKSNVPQHYDERVKRATRKSAAHPSAQSPKSSRRYDLIDRSTRLRRVVEFPGMKGRTLEKVEFSSSSEYHCITLSFADNTSLDLEIELEPAFKLQAELARWKDGNARRIKGWPAIRSET